MSKIMISRSQAIKNLLTAYKVPMSDAYSLAMECQVNVAQDGGQRVEGDYKGHKWHGWTDGLQTWKPFRIPYNAMSDPHYDDPPMNFDLESHAEGIGMTGWNWQDKVSLWVAYDFDAIVGHSDRHTRKSSDEEIEKMRKIVEAIPWITLRKSTGGKGLHLYVFLPRIATVNHNEHAALARGILGKLSTLTNFDFKSKVDICGGNMWVWHRKMKDTDGLALIKQGETLTDIPLNWRDHLDVVKGTRKRALPKAKEIKDQKEEDEFELLVGQQKQVELDEHHKKLLAFLESQKAFHWWDPDRHLLVAHTYDLKLAHTALELRGLFETIAKGTERGQDQNCFCFPLKNGGWSVRRHTPGVEESNTWTQDASGWTKCFFNKEPDLGTVARAFGGVEHSKGGFGFDQSDKAQKTLEMLGMKVKVPAAPNKTVYIKYRKDGRLQLEIERTREDDGGAFRGWSLEKNTWVYVLNNTPVQVQESEVHNYDEMLRHIVSADTQEDCGWRYHPEPEGGWRNEPKDHIKLGLLNFGYKKADIDIMLGDAVNKAWKIVNLPFQPEYPGDRQWNMDAAQLRFIPSLKELDQLNYPTWTKILNHVGKGLDSAIQKNEWAKENSIITGADYLKCWAASMLQFPMEPLPYIFLFGPQNSGKSILHEALQLLLIGGYARAENALINQQGFNGEIANAVLCVTEELDLSKMSHTAYNRIKDWVTSLLLPVHPKNGTPYVIRNSTHWIQCSNYQYSCPIFPGDTRITMIYVGPLSEMIPKKQMIGQLESEAPDFLRSLLTLEIPKSNDRLNIPVVNTAEKMNAIEYNVTPLEAFIKERCHYFPGSMIEFREFYDQFNTYLDADVKQYWSKIKVGKELPAQFVKGRSTTNGQMFIGNISWIVPVDSDLKKPKCVIEEGFIKVEVVNGTNVQRSTVQENAS